MLVDLRPTDRLRKGNGAVVQSVLGSILHAVGDESLDLDKLRIVCDWVQYKHSFRDAVEIRPILSGTGSERLEIGVDLRRASVENHDVRVDMARALARRSESDRHYLEPWSRTTASVIWSFNALYWKALGLWEAVSGRPYEQALPGGESDARNAAAARDQISRLFATWDGLAERRALPDQLHVLELGVGNGNQARVWLDTFVEIDRESGRDYYRRLHYLMGDYSAHLLDCARAQLRHHEDHVSAIVLDATQTVEHAGLPEVQDVLRLHLQRLRQLADRRDRAHRRPPTSKSRRAPTSAPPRPQEIANGLRRDRGRAARISSRGSCAWDPNCWPKRSRAGFPTRTRRCASGPRSGMRSGSRSATSRCRRSMSTSSRRGISGEVLRPLMEANGDVRMHVSNGAAASFVDTLPLLHPHGVLECHDIFVTERRRLRERLSRAGQVRGVGGELGQRRRAGRARRPPRLRRHVPQVRVPHRLEHHDDDRRGARMTETLLPTTVVGSYSVPEWLERAKTDFHEGRISRTSLNEIYETAIKAALKDQERAGIDIVSDGELRRDNDIDYFLERIPGIVLPKLAKVHYYDYYEAAVTAPLPPPDDSAGIAAGERLPVHPRTDRQSGQVLVRRDRSRSPSAFATKGTPTPKTSCSTSRGSSIAKRASSRRRARRYCRSTSRSWPATPRRFR